MGLSEPSGADLLFGGEMISSGKSVDEQCRIVGSGDGSDRTAWSRTQVGPLLLYESPAPVASSLSFSFVFEAVLSVDYREVIFLPIRVSPSLTWTLNSLFRPPLRPLSVDRAVQSKAF